MALQPDAGATPSGTLDIGIDAAALRDVVVEIPAAAVTSMLPARAAVAVGGTLVVTAPAFAWSGERGSGAMSVRWRDARLVAGGTVADLGTVDLALVPQDKGLAGRLTNSGGDVRIDGSVTLAQAAISVDATVAPLPAAPPAIPRALAALGTPDSAGAVRIAWRGNPR